MSRIYNCVIGEVDSSPFAPRSKMIGEELIGSLVGSGLSAVGSLLGLSSSKSANQQNIELQRETNAQNYKIFKENQAWQEDMWNKQNEYNLPTNVVERLKAAGINPSAVFGSGSATPAGSVGAVNSPTMQAAHVNPYQMDLSGVGQAVNAFFDNQLKNKAAEGSGLDNQAKMIDNQYKAMHHIGDLLEQKHRIDKLISEGHLNDKMREYYEKQSEYLGLSIQKFKDTYEVSVEREHLQNDVMRNQAGNLLADSTLKMSQSRFQNLLSAFYPSMAQSEINLRSAQATQALQNAALMVKEGKLTDLKSTAQVINNGIMGYLFHDTEAKHGKFSSRPGLMQDIKDFSSYAAGLIFDNLKLFK